MISNSSIPNCQAIEFTPPLIPQAAQRSRSTIKRALPPLIPASAACWKASASAWVLVMGLTLKVICRGLGLLPELMPKKFWPPISNLAMVELSVSLPAVDKPRRCLYSASSSKRFGVLSLPLGFCPDLPLFWCVPYFILTLVCWEGNSTGATSPPTWHLRQSAVGAIAFHSLFGLVEDAIACAEFG